MLFFRYLKGPLDTKYSLKNDHHNYLTAASLKTIGKISVMTIEAVCAVRA